MRKALYIGKNLLKMFYYSSAALALATPDIRVTNAALGLVGGIWIGKGVAGVAARLMANKKHNEAESGYDKPGLLSGKFNKLGPTLALGLLGGTALATTGYVGANAYHDIKYNDRAPVWAVAGNAVDAVYSVARPILSGSADFGQAVTQNINPLPKEWQQNADLNAYGTTLDGLAKCFDDVMENKPSFAGTCGDRMNGVVNTIFDRNQKI